MKSLATRLAERRAQSLYRVRRLVQSAQGPELVVDGKPLLAFCSNDYLGLANHPNVVAAFQRGAAQYGVGSGAAHLVSGHMTPHQCLEEELAAFTGRDRALLFSTGYMANLGVIGALLDRHDHALHDRLNHASLLDASRYSGARFSRYRHGDMQSLAHLLDDAEAGDKLIVTDGVFSMDGDIAPLPELVALAQRHQAWLMVDDAHGLGVLGARGAGTLEHFALSQNEVPILMGTLGKAFGTFGAFVAGSADLIEFLIQEARTFVYTTALPPAVAEATRASLQLVQEEPWRRAHLQELIAQFRLGAEQIGLRLMPSQTPIQPVLFGAAETTLAVAQCLHDQGVLVPAIRPPTVARGAARLRIAFSTAHSKKHVSQLLSALEVCITRLAAHA